MISADIIKLLYALLPGFVSAWIFYGLTPHPRKEMFERAVQALIFTAFVQALLLPFRLLSRAKGWGPWGDDTKLVVSLVVAVAIGFVFSGFANNNTFHEWLRKRRWYLLRKQPDEKSTGDGWRWTKRTSFPSEWFSALSRDRRHVILHLDGNRRIFGWPFEWPDSSDSGHFVLTDASWMREDNEMYPCSVKRVIISATTVELVEVLNNQNEVNLTEQELKANADRMVAYNKELEAKKNGKQGTSTTATTERHDTTQHSRELQRGAGSNGAS